MMNLMETISGSGVGLFGSTETVHFTEPSSVNLTAFFQEMDVNIHYPWA